MKDIQNYYEDKISCNNSKLNKLKIKSHRFLWIYLVLVTILVVALVLFFNHYVDGKICCLAILVSIITYLNTLIYDKKNKTQIEFYDKLNEVYINELHYLKKDFSYFDSGESFVDKGHEYSYDLDLFGDNSFYNRINRTFSPKGSALLANKLKNLPTSSEDVKMRQSSIMELEQFDDFRHNFLALSKLFDNEMSFPKNFQTFYKESFITTTACLVMLYSSVFFTLGSVVLAYFSIISVSIPTILLIVQLIIPIIYSKKINQEGNQIGKLHRNMSNYSKLVDIICKTEFKAKNNLELKEQLVYPKNARQSLKELSQILLKFDQRENAYVLILLNSLTLRDVFLLRKLRIWKKNYITYIEIWISVIAEFEALVSLSVSNFNNPYYSLPTILENNCQTLIKGSGFGHPFISYDKLVLNDFEIKPNKFIIITGANMAGKSTFLRSIGISYIMAVNGMKVCAKQFEVSMFKLFSSMRNSDDLSSGISYFNAELNRISQLIDYIKKNEKKDEHTFILLDEILKGTNSRDRLNGSIMFLDKVSNTNTSGIIATHDLELSKLELDQEDKYTNYCFEIDLNTDLIQYDYQIKKGVSKNMNASILLANILNN